MIDFTTTVTAFGVDLRAFTGFPTTATMTIYGLDDTTVIGTLSAISLSTSGIPVFAGWQDSSGIGKVALTQTGEPYSPIIDNLEFGVSASIPEPTSVVFVGLGLVALGVIRKRRIH